MAVMISALEVADGHPDPTPLVTRDGDRLVVWLEGDCAAGTLQSLTDTLAVAISVDSADVIVDMSDVTFLDGATVKVLIRLHNYLAQDSRVLTFRSPSRSAARVLDRCRLTSIIEPARLTLL